MMDTWMSARLDHAGLPQREGNWQVIPGNHTKHAKIAPKPDSSYQLSNARLVFWGLVVCTSDTLAPPSYSAHNVFC